METKMEEGKYLGTIEPHFGRWTWPYSKMIPGDYFHVDHAERSVGQMRNMSGVRGAQLNKRFSVTGDDPARPGFCRVECVPAVWDMPDVSTANIKYVLFAEKLLEWYGLDHNRDIEIGGPRRRYDAPADITPAYTRITVTLPEQDLTFGLELDADGFTYIPLPFGWSCAKWEKWGEQRPEPEKPPAAQLRIAAPETSSEEPQQPHPVDHMFASPEEQAEHDAARWRKQDAAIAAAEQMIAELGLE